MDQIKLKRGGKKITYKKVPDYFAVRLNQGKANRKKALEACCGRPKSEVEH